MLNHNILTVLFFTKNFQNTVIISTSMVCGLCQTEDLKCQFVVWRLLMEFTASSIDDAFKFCCPPPQGVGVAVSGNGKSWVSCNCAYLSVHGVSFLLNNNMNGLFNPSPGSV